MQTSYRLWGTTCCISWKIQDQLYSFWFCTDRISVQTNSYTFLDASGAFSTVSRGRKCNLHGGSPWIGNSTTHTYPSTLPNSFSSIIYQISPSNFIKKYCNFKAWSILWYVSQKHPCPDLSSVWAARYSYKEAWCPYLFWIVGILCIF